MQCTTQNVAHGLAQEKQLTGTWGWLGTSIFGGVGEIPVP